MGAPHTIQADGKTYTVVDDFTSTYRALIIGSVTDEILGAFRGPVLSISAGRSDLKAKVTTEGLFAVTGYAEKVFPQLASMSYTVTLDLSAAGFDDQPITVAIPVNAAFPVSAGVVAMRRSPITVQGRVVANTAQRAPIAAAKIVTVDDPSTPPTIHAVALRCPLSLAHASGKTINQIALTSTGNGLLQAAAISGSSALTLSTLAGLSIGSIAQLSNPAATQVEYAIVTALDAGPLTAALRDPLNVSFPAGTAVQFLKPGAVAASATLSAGADAGDGVLMSSQLLDQTLEIDPGGASVEYREAGAFTDADGYYSIAGVGRFQQLFFEASHSGFTSVTRGWMVEYDQPVNVVDFRL